MKHGIRICLSVGVLSAFGLSPQVQGQANTPAPNYIQISREEVKVGHGAAHVKTEMGWPRAFSKANWTSHFLALVSSTGPNEAWYLTPYESLEAWEKDTKGIAANAALTSEIDRLSAEDSQHLNGYRSFVVRYRADLSHRPGVSVPTQRHFSITIVRIRPGHISEFEEVRKMNVEGHKKAGINDNHTVYQVVAGMPAGTFLILTPYKSMAEADAARQLHGQAFRDAMGGDAGQKKINELNSSSTISSETNYFTFSPEMSYPSKEYIEADPSFWKPKPAKAPAAKKEDKPAAK